MGCIDQVLNWFWPWRRADRAFDYAKACYGTYQTTKAERDLLQSIDSYRLAYQYSGEGHNVFPGILTNYAAALHEHNEKFGGAEGQSENVIALLERAALLSEPKDPPPAAYPTLLINLGSAYLEKYHLTKAEGDFRSAVKFYDKARMLASAPIIIFIQSYIGLGIAHWSFCELRGPQTEGEEDHLYKAIKYLNRALNEVPKLPVEKQAFWRAKCLQNLACAHDVRHTHHPDRLDDLESAITYNKDALKLIPGHPDTLFNLSKQYFRRYAEKKEPNDLKLAEESFGAVKRMKVEDDEISEKLGSKIEELEHKIQQYKNRGDTTMSVEPEPQVAGDRSAPITDGTFTTPPTEDLGPM